MPPRIKSEFRLRSFCLRHADPYKFVRSEWPIPQNVFVGWRAFWAAWHVVWLIVSIEDEVANARYAGAGVKWLIYLTNLSYMILVAQSLCFLAVVVYHTFKLKKVEPASFREEITLWYHSVLWLLTTLAFNTAVLVTILYWKLVYTGPLKLISLMTHGFNSVYVLSDIFIIAIPVRLLHVIYTIIYAVAYLLFSLIYHFAGGTDRNSLPYIYKALNWTKASSSAVLSVGVIIVGIPIIHLSQFALFKFRIYLAKRCPCMTNRAMSVTESKSGRMSSTAGGLGNDFIMSYAHTIIESVEVGLDTTANSDMGTTVTTLSGGSSVDPKYKGPKG